MARTKRCCNGFTQEGWYVHTETCTRPASKRGKTGQLKLEAAQERVEKFVAVMRAKLVAGRALGNNRHRHGSLSDPFYLAGEAELRVSDLALLLEALRGLQATGTRPFPAPLKGSQKTMADGDFVKWAESSKPCRYCRKSFTGPVCPCERKS